MARDDTTGSDETGDSREQGVEFGRLADELESIEYPVTLDELLAEHGDAELGVADGSVTLREVLGPLAAGDADGGQQRFESAEGVRQAVFNMVGDEAVGREDYSDRGGSLRDEVDAGEDEGAESL